jgi:hypothetical protein
MRLIEAVEYSAETQTVLYGKKHARSTVAQWMSRMICEYKDFHSQQFLHFMLYDYKIYKTASIK